MTELVQTLVLGLLIGGVYALLASGLTLIFGVMDVINVAHGAFVILASFITWTLWRGLGLDPLALVPVMTVVMFAVGWVVYVAAVRRIRGAPASMSVLLTFALALVLEGVMGLGWSNVYHSTTPAYATQSYHLGSFYFPKAQVYACGVALVVLGLLYVLLARTWLGRAIRSASQNGQGARLVGVDVAAVSALTFAVGVATTGAGGAIQSVLYPFLPGSHYQWISRLLGIIVLGGMGSLPGAAVGALLLGVAETTTATYVSLGWATAVPYAVVVVVLLLRPSGLLGTRLREDVAV